MSAEIAKEWNLVLELNKPRRVKAKTSWSPELAPPLHSSVLLSGYTFRTALDYVPVLTSPSISSTVPERSLVKVFTSF